MRHLYLLLSGILGLLSTLPARATHVTGGQISYAALGNNQYRVRIERYFDPSSPASAAVDVVLACKRNGCTTTGAGSFTTTLYNSAIAPTTPPTCGAVLPYRLHVAEGTVTLPPGQWTLSIDDQNRYYGTSNLLSSENYPLHLAAYLDNTRGQADESPRFTELDMPYAPLRAIHRYSFGAFDTDGDSLVYSLVPAQWSARPTATAPYECPRDMLYTSYPADTLTDPITRQFGTIAAGSFSGTFPLPSFHVSNGVAQPWVELNSATGLLQFAPIKQGRYAVAVRVDEYRRLGGTAMLIGSTTREVSCLVVASANKAPTLTMNDGSLAVPFEQPIYVQPGLPVALTFNATDPDAGQALRLSSNVASLLPGSTFQALTATSARFLWTVPPTAAGQYAFTVRVTDNACPINGSETRTVLLRVNRLRPTAGVLAKDRIQSTAYPSPFTTQVAFRLQARRVQSLIVVDGLGRVVAHLRSAPDGLVTWAPATLPAGLYFARTADAAETVRLIKAE